MIFTTFQFLVFFVCVFILFFTVPISWRKPLLLIASYYFYMCSIPWYVTVIIAITLIDYVAGICIENATSRHAKRAYLTASIISNFGLLACFKYVGFFALTLNDIFGLGVPVLRFILPLGLSFHTFQAVSYTIEVYRGRSPAERNLLTYALYVAFFPQMVAGPIERPYNLLPQFHKVTTLAYDRFTSGLEIAMWGAFKKLVVANLLAPPVNTAYSHPQHYAGPILALATFFFAVQIYCDFSGYSDIAIGIARMMGYDLMINFRQPYFARSIGEFWHRWHISLSTWFRDYLYIPLGGSRVSKARYFGNVMFVFLVSGLWHGASWTFAVWGTIHGLYLIVGHVTSSFRNMLRTKLGLNRMGGLLTVLQSVTTFALVTVAWVFFRAATVKEGLYVVSHLASTRGLQANDFFVLGLPRFEMALLFPVILVVAVTEWFIAYKPASMTRLWSWRPFRWTCAYTCVFATIFFGVFGHVEFIYFQF